jgi:hypothetical protein
MDSWIDGANDVGVDARIDIGPSSDAGLDPGWRRLAGFPDDCYVERALHPENVLAFHWEPCIDDLPACQMAVLDWSAYPLDAIGPLNGGNGSGHTFVWQLVEPGRAHSILCATHDDACAAAWRSRYVVGSGHTACLAQLTASEEGIGANAASVDPGALETAHIAVAPWGDLSALDSNVWTSSASLIRSGDVLQTPSTSATTFAGMLQSGNILAVEPPTAQVLGQGDLGPVVVGHSVLWNWGDATGATAIHISRIGGTEVELYRAPAGVSSYAVRADGTWITWLIYDASRSTETLWAAPYRETSPLARRPLWGDLARGTSGTIGGGFFAHVDSGADGLQQPVHVVDLTDGSRRTVQIPYTLPDASGWRITGDPTWVSRDELAFPAGRISSTARLQTVLRIDLTALPVEPLPRPDAGIDGGR